MLLSLLPTTALAATYPDNVRVYNASGNSTSLSDGECLATNDGSAITYTSGSHYVARYEASTGTLFLKDYKGVAVDAQIYADGDLNIVVESDSSFTTSLSSATNPLYGIQANGKLNISGSGTLTVSATGKGNVYGIYAKEGVTISAPLAVTVKKNNTEETGPVYGIYTESGAISLSGAEDKTVTATGGKEFAYGVYNKTQTPSSAAGNGNIDITGKLTVNLSGGSNYNRGISSQGGDITLNGATVKILGSYYYGIFNKSGNVVIKSCPDVKLTSTTSTASDGEGICTYDGGDLNIENSTVKVSANGLAAELKGNVSIKDSMVDLTRTSRYYEVIRTGNSSAENTIDLSTEGSVTLTASGEQTNNAMITGKVTLGLNTKCEKGKPDGNSYDGAYDTTSNTTVLKFVHESTAPTYSVDITAGTGMTLASGTASQSGLTGAMTEVVYTADTGYYFPTDYSSVGTSDGVTVKRDSYTQITVSGTPTGTVNITLADATAKTEESTPTASFTATGPDSGTLSGVDSGLKYQTNSGAWTDITSSADVALTGLSDCTINVVKKGNGTTTTDSTAQTITVNKATAPTGVTAVDCTAAGNDGKLENVTADMEYQKSDAAAWTACVGTEVSALTNGTYYVRVKVNGTTLASDSQSVTINAFGTTPAAEPNASFTATGRDAGTLVISGTYTSTMQYSVDGGIGWNAVTSASMDITGVTAASGIRVKDAGNGGTTSASSVKNITVTEGTKPTGLAVTQPSTIGGKGKIETDTSHEYNTDGGTTFTPCTGALDKLTVGNYHVRVKAVGNMLASETETYTITAFTGTPETRPAATFTATGPDGGTLSGLVSGGNYDVTGTATANFTASGTTHDLTGVVVGTLSIVKKGDGITTTDSTAQTIPVAKAATPSTVTAVGCTTGSNNDGKLKNVTTAMEYQQSGAGSWTNCGGSEVTGLTNGTYLVRVKAIGTTLASDNQSVVVALYTGGTSGGTSSGGSSGGGYVPTTQKPDIKAGEGGSIVLSKDGTTATITPNAGMMIDKVMLNGKDMGALTVVKGIKTGDKLEVSFKQTAEEKAKMDKAVAEQVGKAGLTARSARTAKKNVKLVVKSDLEGITDAGYTVEYKFYRSTKKSAGYKAMKTGKSGIYINTYGKKGTLYYYKVKVMVYDKDGNLTAQSALKQCKYASRLWTK